VVSDTWDFWQVITGFAVTLKDEILARTPDALGNAKVVFRPDSGDPVRILGGYRDSEVSGPAADGRYQVIETGEWISDAERRGAVQCLWDIFGGSESERGYKMLNPRVGLIYGDSITLARARDILKLLADKGFASSNVVFGIGSYTYQYLTRDSFGWALKATYAEVDGIGRELVKDPITDSGVKRSAQGLLRVEQEGDRFVLYDRQTLEQAEGGALRPVFRDGKLLVEQTLGEIRGRLQASWQCPESENLF